MDIKWWADYVHRCRVNDWVSDCNFGNKECNLGHWTELRYSPVTGWSQNPLLVSKSTT